jgi:hypothetical protein
LWSASLICSHNGQRQLLLLLHLGFKIHRHFRHD